MVHAAGSTLTPLMRPMVSYQVVPVMWGHVVDHGVQDILASGRHITESLAAVVERQT